MVEPVNSIQKISSNQEKDNPTPRETTTAKPQEVPPVDSVDINSESLVDSLRAEVETLGQELPRLVQSALLEPVTSSAAQEPLNALIFRLQEPLETIISKSGGLSDEQIAEIQEELANFKLVFPSLKDSALISPLLAETAQEDRLNVLIQGFNTQVDSLISDVGLA